MSYIENVLNKVSTKFPEQLEFLQAIEEVLKSIDIVLKDDSKYEKYSVLERIIEPERQILFRVPWVDDKGKIQVNTGYRVQFNSALGPYKGGLRFHPSVNLSIVKFLGFEQIFKNALTGLPIGGGKGGSDFDPKGKSENEIMMFCQSFMSELYKHINQNIDVPAGDIGVGAREVGFMFGQYKKLTKLFEGVLTGKPLLFGGSFVRTQATGYGLVYMLEEMAKDKQIDLKDKKVIVSGSGNVSIFTAEKLQHLGAKVIAMSDSNGFVLDEEGISLEIIKDIKLINYGRISQYSQIKKSSTYYEKGNIWNIKCDIAIPGATQNEINLEDAKILIKNGVIAVCEGSNMSSSNDAINAFIENKILFLPSKAANSGGVATSALEMSQNSLRLKWSFEEVDSKLQNIMRDIYTQIKETSLSYDLKDNFVAGANITSFKKVADAMISQGVV